MFLVKTSSLLLLFVQFVDIRKVTDLVPMGKWVVAEAPGKLF